MDRQTTLENAERATIERATADSIRMAEEAASFISKIPQKDKVDTLYAILTNLQSVLVETRTKMIAALVLWETNTASFEAQQNLVKSVESYKHVITDNMIFKEAFDKITSSKDNVKVNPFSLVDRS